MASNNFFKSDLYSLHNIIQASMMVYPKEMIIYTLRDFFSKDSYYHYSKDAWGFPNTIDHTDLEPGAGINNDLTTRVYIGENYRYDKIYYPAILVKSGGMRYVPISINRNQGTIQYENIIYTDGYGNNTVIKRPKTLVTAGAWEGSIVIDVFSRSLRSRDDLVELVGMCFTELYYEELRKIGIVVKPLSIGSPTELDDRNDKLFRQSITLDIRTEWRREIPVENLVDSILFTIMFENLSNSIDDPAPNLTIRTELINEDLV